MSDLYSGLVNWKTRKTGAQFNKYDIFDRVINLRLLCGNATKPDDIVVRSDYEIYSKDFLSSKFSSIAVGLKPMQGVVRRCQMKPSIKVQYKQYAGNTQVDLDIYIQNFFVLTSDGQTLLQFSANEYPLHSVEIQLGYFGQWADMYKVSPNGVPTADDYFALKAPQEVQTITCNVDYVQTESLPPDYTIHIHGFVGSGLMQSAKETASEGGITTTINIPSAGGEEVTARQSLTKTEYSSYHHYLFENVTRRFLRRSVVSRNPVEQALVLNSAKMDKDGLLSESDAKKYGVRVFVSQGVQEHYKSYGKEQLLDENGEPVKDETYFELALDGDTPMQCLNNFVRMLPLDVRIAPCINGDYLMFTASESKTAFDLGKEGAKWYTYDHEAIGYEASSDNSKVDGKKGGFYECNWRKLSAYLHLSARSIGSKKLAQLEQVTPLEERTESFIGRELPAVYNINAGAIATIVCPFYFFLNPMDSVKFRSRYAKGSLVGYFADYTAKDEEYTALWQSVSFATVDNINEMQITCSVPKGKGV